MKNRTDSINLVSNLLGVDSFVLFASAKYCVEKSEPKFFIVQNMKCKVEIIKASDMISGSVTVCAV